MAGTRGYKADMTAVDSWGLDDFVSYIENSHKIGFNSSQYKEVQKALAAVQAAEAKEATVESAIELMNAGSQLVRACDTYLNKRTGSSTDIGKERLDVIGRLKTFQQEREQELAPIREAKVARSYAGKTWKEVKKPPVAEIHLDGKVETAGANSSVRYKVEYNGKKGFFSEENPALDKEAQVDRILERQQDPKVKELLEKNRDWIRPYLDAPKQNMKEQLEDKIRSLKGQDPEERDDELLKNLEELAQNGKAVHACQELYDDVQKMETAVFIGNLRYDGADISKRNIATSRMASLLGIDNIVARSEKMVVWKDGHRMEGCFMEFAEGLDLNSQREEDKKLKEEMTNSFTAGYNKDEATLEIFDYICAQGDRHGKNMFYKLSDVREDGMRHIIGLQGIDNDLAFNDHGTKRLGRANPLSQLSFIDKTLAEKVEGLDRRALEYAVGDLLNPAEMDSLELRVKELQTHMKTKMVHLSGEEWKLDKFDTSKYPKDLSGSGLSEEDKIYINGLRALEVDRNMVHSGNSFHRAGQAKHHLNEENKAVLDKQASEAYAIEGAKDLFAEAEGREAEHKTIEEVREELIGEKEAARQRRAEEFARKKEMEKAAPKRMDFRELERQERKTNLRIGGYRERQKEAKPLEKDRQAHREAGMGKR